MGTIITVFIVGSLLWLLGLSMIMFSKGESAKDYGWILFIIGTLCYFVSFGLMII